MEYYERMVCVHRPHSKEERKKERKMKKRLMKKPWQNSIIQNTQQNKRGKLGLMGIIERTIEI
jgi:hypothetical protein